MEGQYLFLIHNPEILHIFLILDIISGDSTSSFLEMIRRIQLGIKQGRH